MGGIFFKTRDNLTYTMGHNEKRKKKKGKKPESVRHAPQALIADDDPHAIELLQIVLVNFGFETTLAFDGKDALRQLSKKSFDLIFLDMSMPEMTGSEVLAKIEELRLRNLERCEKWHLLPIITYSSYDKEELKLPEEKGFYVVDNWQKPLSLPELTTLTGHTIAHLALPTPVRDLPPLVEAKEAA